MRFSRIKLNEFADEQESAADRHDEAARDARATAADSGRPQHERGLAARCYRVHRDNARQARENAEALRAGYQPDEL